MRIEVYTDGSATTKDKPGGYGWVIIVNGKFHSEGSGSIPNATNNDAELEAAIMGLGNAYKFISTQPECTEPNCDDGVIITTGPHHQAGMCPVCEENTVVLVSDSQIVLGWLSGVYRFKQVAKQEKYLQFMRLKGMMGVIGRWVEGHTGDKWNERCDKLAGVQRRLAMGIEPKKKVDRSLVLKKACKEMADALEYIKRECEDLKRDKLFTRDDFIDMSENALEHYAEALGKIK